MTIKSNETAYSYWEQLFARQAESPWATVVDPDHDPDADRKVIREGLLKAGWSPEMVEFLIEERADSPNPSEGNSPGIANHVVSNFDRLCNDIETVLDKLGQTTHAHVARGIDPVSGPSAAMTPVTMTDEAVISVSAFFFRYCGVVARATTRTLQIDPPHWDTKNYTLAEDRAKMREHPLLLYYWFQIMSSFAVTGTNIMVPYKPSLVHEVLLMEQIAYAMEIYAIAHEYGHHHLGHGRDITENAQTTEYEADAFSSRVSAILEQYQTEMIPNHYLGSGAGAMVLLRSLELLRKYSETITRDAGCNQNTHPDIEDRIKKFERLGLLEPKKFHAYASFRNAITRIFDALNAELIDVLNIIPEKYLIELRNFHEKAHPPKKPGFL